VTGPRPGKDDLDDLERLRRWFPTAREEQDSRKEYGVENRRADMKYLLKSLT